MPHPRAKPGGRFMCYLHRSFLFAIDTPRSARTGRQRRTGEADFAVKTTVLHDLDFDRDGRQQSYLRVPQSRNRAGWGTVEIPITVVKNGRGPTILFTGGVHGDEFDGQIAVSRLARELDPAAVQGRVIMI